MCQTTKTCFSCDYCFYDLQNGNPSISITLGLKLVADGTFPELNCVQHRITHNPVSDALKHKDGRLQYPSLYSLQMSNNVIVSPGHKHIQTEYLLLCIPLPSNGNSC